MIYLLLCREVIVTGVDRMVPYPKVGTLVRPCGERATCTEVAYLTIDIQEPTRCRLDLAMLA